MVKVTFNSALAQKEAKKDESKSGEEALIIPPDAVAVDCKNLIPEVLYRKRLSFILIVPALRTGRPLEHL